ncbi:hypothetical protein [Bremerella cremea]|uniref:hypothetical protein n=1 Tax=Bremerella cremea TaxID=1031537 RepID=UPI0031F11C0D
MNRSLLPNLRLLATLPLAWAVLGCGSQPAAVNPVAQPGGSLPATPSETAPTETISPTADAIATSFVTKDPRRQIVPRNPFRPPMVTTRTVDSQLESRTSDIRLLGTARRDSQQIALFETGGKVSHAVVGEFVNDWEVTLVGKSEATLRKGLEQITLRID